MDVFDFGLRIRELREARHMSQETLGKKVGRSKPVISSYENNIKIPPLEVLIKMSSIFNVSLDYLAGTEKGEVFDCGGLTAGQIKLMNLLADEFRSKNKAQKGLTQSQQQILNLLLIEFFE